MSASLVHKGLRDLRGAVAGWSIGLALLALMYMAFFPSIQENPAFDDYAESLPDAAEAFFGDLSAITTLPGYLDAELFALLPLVLAILAIGRGSHALVGQEEEGTMDLLMAQPVTRAQVVHASWISLALATLTVLVATGIGLVAGALLMGIETDLVGLMVWCLVAWPPVMLLGTVALIGSAAVKRKRTAIFVATVLAIGSYVLNGLAQLVEVLEPFQALSLFHHYGQSKPLTTGIDVASTGLLVGLTLIGLVVAAVLFERKDLTT